MKAMLLKHLPLLDAIYEVSYACNLKITTISKLWKKILTNYENEYGVGYEKEICRTTKYTSFWLAAVTQFKESKCVM